jgi:hypothetical protein
MSEDSGPLADVGQVASKRVGPAPLWVWAAVLAALVIAWSWWRNRQAATASTAVDPTAADNAVTLPGDLGTVGTGTLPESPSVGGLFGNPFATVTDWVSAVVQAAASLGGTPLDVSTAINRYLSGQSLSAAQQAIINAALARFGAPPGGIPTTPPSSSTPPPAAGKTATRLQLVPSQGSGIRTPTLYVYWTDAAGKPISGVVELQQQRGGTFYDVSTVAVTANGSGRHQVSIGAGKTATYRAQSLLTNPKYTQTTSNVVTVKG